MGQGEGLASVFLLSILISDQLLCSHWLALTAFVPSVPNVLFVDGHAIAMVWSALHLPGICQSDVHLIDGDWGRMSSFPQVCGHEVVGVVREKGARVKQ